MTTTLQAPARSARYAAYAAAIWALGFAAVNLYLQFRGIDDPRVQRSWAAFTAVNLSVTVVKIAGAAVALATVLPWGRALPDRLVAVAAWAAAAVLLLYAGTGTVRLTVQGGWGETVDAGGTFAVPAWAYLLFFAAPGACFAMAAADHLRRTGTARRWALLGAVCAPLLLASVVLALSAAVS